VEERLDKQLELEKEQMELEQETQKTYEDMIRSLVTQRELWTLTNDEREIATQLLDAQAQAQGRLNDEQLRQIEIELRRTQKIVPRDEQFSDFKDFEGAKGFMGREFLADMRTFGQEMAIIFGPGGTLHSGLLGVTESMSDIIAHSIVFGDSWNDTVEAIKGVGRMIVTEVLSSLIRIPIQMAINETIASALRTKATTETVAQSVVITETMAPAAAATSLATAGGNSVGATTAIIGVAALAAGVLAGAALFEDGGYTGDGGRGAVAGLVHGKEFVLHADATRKYRGEAEAMNAGTYRAGGGRQEMNVYITNQAPGVEFETRRIDENTMEVIARRVVRETAPAVIAEDLQSPQSKTGRAIAQTTSAKRTRS
jgi:hypothetical protein